MGPGHDPAGKPTAVVIERHVEKLRADLRGLSRGAFGAGSEQAAELAETRCAERRPAEQTRAEDAERDRYRQVTLDTRKRGHGERYHAAADLDRAREHNRIRRTKHLQQEVEQDN